MRLTTRAGKMDRHLHTIVAERTGSVATSFVVVSGQDCFALRAAENDHGEIPKRRSAEKAAPRNPDQGVQKEQHLADAPVMGTWPSTASFCIQGPFGPG